MIQKFIQDNKEHRLRIVVLGDSMIDEYQYGKVDRVSPEFPVPIMICDNRNKEEFCPGGAANVCLQMKHFNVDSFLISFIDEEAHCLFKDLNINYCVKIDGRIPKKVRFYDGDFPLHRWDIESPNYGKQEASLNILREMALKSFDSLIEKSHLSGKKIDAVILSDYNKGFWTDDFAQAVIKKCKKENIISVVDPKKTLLRWQGCNIFKPNAKEATALSGRNENQIDFLQDALKCDGVVITQSGRGVIGKYREEHFEHWCRKTKEVNSVIGAGDCFAAVMTIALAHGFDLRDSCALAFEGGVQYVKARHNKPITPFDIYTRFDSAAAKIISIEELIYLKNNVYLGEEFVMAGGCFQILHLGHINTLRFAKNKGDKLIIGLNSDESVKRIKNKLVNDWDSRAIVLAALECVDFVVGFDEDTPYNLIKKLQPKFLIKGSDYQIEQVVGRDLVDEVFLAPTIAGFSTTNIIKNCQG